MLSTTATHALRAMTALAHGDGGAFLAREISEACDVPVAYLSKILLALKKAGLIAAVRGRGGGYRLGRPPEQIRLVDVVLPFDVIRARPGCFFEPSRPCVEESSCCAHDRWEEVRNSFVDFLESTTLAQLSKGSGETPAGRGLPVSCFVGASPASERRSPAPHPAPASRRARRRS